MHHDPKSDLRNIVVKTLTAGYQVRDEEAGAIAARVGTYLDVEDVGGAHFELLNVTLNWKALCGAVVEGEMVLAGHFAGLPLVGALRWFDSMRYYYQFNANWQYPHREALAIDHVEAATCMALWKQEAEAPPYSPDDTLEGLLERANDSLREAAFETIDKGRLQAVMDRLKMLRCLTSRAGWYRLRDVMKYQIPEE